MIIIDVSPVAFSIGPVRIGWYGIMVALAVVTLIIWALRAVKQETRLNYDMVLTAALVGIPSGIIVSRLLHVIDLWEYYFQNPGRILGSFGEGLTIWGAVLGAALGIWLYSLFSKKFPFGVMADILAPGILLAQMIGRVGCTLNGCCYGQETHLPWAITYSHPESVGPIGIPVHPTQIYEIIYLAIAFLILFWLRRRLKPDGSLFLVYLSCYSLWRLGVDFIRDGTPLLFGLHEAQVIAIVVLLITVPLLVIRTRRVKKEPENEKESGQPV